MAGANAPDNALIQYYPTVIAFTAGATQVGLYVDTVQRGCCTKLRCGKIMK